MCLSLALALTAVSGAVSAYGSYSQGKSQEAAYKYAAGQNKLAADAAIARAQKQSELVQDTAKAEGKQQAVKTAQMIGAQRAAMAAMGIDPSSVTAQDVVLDSYSKSKMDEAMIRRNADSQTWALNEQAKADQWQLLSQADQYTTAGRQAKKAGTIGAFSSLLSSASSIAGAKK